MCRDMNLTTGTEPGTEGEHTLMIKAGIPYQDPPLDLRIQYEINAGIGDILMGIGFKITVSCCILRLVLNLIRKKWQKK